MHGKVIYLPDAVADLSIIWDYLNEQSGNQEIADRVLRAIHSAALLYADNPAMGIPRFRMLRELRCFRVGVYVAYYLPCDGGIEVLQVIHGSRRIEKHFRRPPRDDG
jgi:toxin ParE1/3/4